MEKLYVSQPLHKPLWHVHPSAYLRRGTQQAAGKPLRPAHGRHWRRGSRSDRTGWSCTCAGTGVEHAASAQERPAAQARTLVVAVDESEVRPRLRVLGTARCLPGVHVPQTCVIAWQESLAAFEWTLRHLFQQGEPD